MKIAIVDDEIVYVAYLEEIINSLTQGILPKIVLTPEIDTYESGKELLESGRDYDLVFLDIYMNDSNGIETANLIAKKLPSTLVVFQTSSSDHYADAFHTHAFDYLVKPYTPDAVEKILNEAIRRIPDVPSSITITVDRMEIAILLDDIVSVESEPHYLNFNINGKPAERTRMTISELNELLGSEPRFLMCSRGIMINMDYMDSYDNDVVKMKDGKVYPIQLTNKKEILKKLHEH